MSPRSTTERRKHKRTRVKDSFCAFAELKFFMLTKPKPGPLQPIIDISQGGMAIASTSFLDPDTKLELSIRFSEDKNIYTGKGRVVYCRKMEKAGEIYRTGIEFVSKDEQLTKAIRYLAEKFV